MPPAAFYGLFWVMLLKGSCSVKAPSTGFGQWVLKVSDFSFLGLKLFNPMFWPIFSSTGPQFFAISMKVISSQFPTKERPILGAKFVNI